MGGSTKVWDELREKIGELAHLRVRVGVMGSGMTDGGTLSLAELAAIHEFGAPSANIPERSFIRAGLRERMAEMRKICEVLAKAVVLGRLDIYTALGRLGLWGQEAVKARIRSNIPPPLKAATIARKGSSIALIDTGQLISGITWTIE